MELTSDRCQRELDRTRPRFGRSGSDGGGSDGDYIWIFEAQVSRGGETDVADVYPAAPSTT